MIGIAIGPRSKKRAFYVYGLLCVVLYVSLYDHNLCDVCKASVRQYKCTKPVFHAVIMHLDIYSLFSIELLHKG